MDDHEPHGFTTPVTSSTLNAVERYSGTADAQSWLTSLEELGTLFGWTQATRLLVAKVRLSGAAQTWAQRRQFVSWDQFQDQFLARFGETRESAIARLERCRQSPGETPRAFADRFLQDADKAGRIEDDALVYQFIQRLHPDLRIEASRKQLRSIEDIVSFCNYWMGCQPNAGTEPAPRGKLQFADENRPAQGSGLRYPRFEGPRPRYNSDKPSYGHPSPPFREQTNRPFPANNPPAQRPQPTPASTGKEVDDLTKQLERMRLNYAQQQEQLREKDRELRHMRHAIQSGGAAPQVNHVNIITPENTYDDPDSLASTPAASDDPAAVNYFSPWDEYATRSTDDDIDPDYLQELMTALHATKRSADDEPVGLRAPHKRTAIDPASLNPYAPPRPINNPLRSNQQPAAATPAAAAAATPAAAAAAAAARSFYPRHPSPHAPPAGRLQPQAL